MGRRWHAVAAVGMAFAAAVLAVAVDGGFPLSLAGAEVAPLPQEEMSMLQKLAYLMFEKDGTSYQHVWPEMVLGWQIILGTLTGFFGAAFGSVGGGGIFVPMLTLIIGFDPKSSTAISKCYDNLTQTQLWKTLPFLYLIPF